MVTLFVLEPKVIHTPQSKDLKEIRKVSGFFTEEDRGGGGTGGLWSVREFGRPRVYGSSLFPRS